MAPNHHSHRAAARWLNSHDCGALIEKLRTTRLMNKRLPALLPADRSPFTSGNGFQMWKTRRADQFAFAIRALEKWESGDIDELLLAAHNISEQIAALVPEDMTELPRGYRMATELRWRVLSLDGAIFSTLGRNLAGRKQIERLHADLVSGLVREIEAAVRHDEKREKT